MRKYLTRENGIFVLFVLYLAFIMNVPYSIFQTSFSSWLPYPYASFCLVLALIGSIKGKTIRLSKERWEILRYFALPIVAVSVVSAVTAVTVHSTGFAVMNSFRKALDVCMAYAFGYFLVRQYREKTVTLLVIAGWVTYSTVIIRYVMAGGRSPFGVADGITLEVHFLTYMFAMIFITRLLKKKKTKADIWILVACGVGIILGDKRALYLAMAVALGIYFLFRKILKYQTKGLLALTAGMVLVAVAWVWFVHSGAFEATVKMLGIRDNSRLRMWNYFQKDYSFSLFYWGRGLTYTDIILAKDPGILLLIVKPITLHNDILRSYIGYGFLPFCYFMWNFLHERVFFLVKKQRIESAWIFFTVTVAYFVINFFDNNLFVSSVSIVYFVLWYELLGKGQGEKLPAAKEKTRSSSDAGLLAGGNEEP